MIHRWFDLNLKDSGNGGQSRAGLPQSSTSAAASSTALARMRQRVCFCFLLMITASKSGIWASVSRSCGFQAGEGPGARPLAGLPDDLTVGLHLFAHPDHFIQHGLEPCVLRIQRELLR